MAFPHPRAAAVALLALVAAVPPAAATDLTVVAVSDVDQITVDDPRGGIDRIAAVIRAERQSGRPVLVLHAGDAISPSVLSGFDQGAHMVDVLNRIGIDVFVPGNHEFDFGPDVFRARMAELRARKLSANIREADGRPLAGFAATETIEIDGIRIGIVGVTTDRTPVASSPGALAFLPAATTAVDVANELRAAGADFVIGVLHLSRGLDFEVARTGAFDLIVSGDDHSLLVSWDGRTALLESREQGEHVAIADIDFTIEAGERRRVTFAPSFRVIDTASVAPDPALAEAIAGHLATLDMALAEEIARTALSIDTRRATVRTEEAAFGNLVADAMRARTGADFAIMNGGGIRADKVYLPDTAITRRDVFAELPFGNTVVLAELSGADLVAALENGFSQLEGTPGRFPQIAGGRVVVDRTRPIGQRLVSFEIGGAPVDPEATYRVATNNFLLRGGDGYETLGRGRVLIPATEGPLLATVVVDHLKALGTIRAQPEGRIAFR